MTKAAIALDCDGVVLNSNTMKTNVFREVLSTFPADDVNRFIEHQKRSFGRSRFRLINDFFADFLGRPADTGQLEGILEAFGQQCSQAYLTVRETEGAFAALRALSANFNLFVVSGSKQDELRHVFKSREIDGLFKGIYGSPRSKVELLREIGATEDIRLFVGDALADLEAAETCSIPFAFMRPYSSDTERMTAFAEQKRLPIINNLSEVINLVHGAANENAN